MADKPSPIRETDDEARRLARLLVRETGHAALGVLDPDSGFPQVSRVLVATDFDGAPAILVSSLAQHARALAADARACLLLGEPGKGDPLAHPRLTLMARARPVARASADHDRLRRRFLARHPKSALYIDFGDFSFLRLEPEALSLNGGFGRAYRLTPEEILLCGPFAVSLREQEEAALEQANKSALDLAKSSISSTAPEDDSSYAIVSLDAAGAYLQRKQRIIRLEFEAEAQSLGEFLQFLAQNWCRIPQF